MEDLITAITDEKTGEWSFAKLEKLVWAGSLEIFRQVLTEILLALDKYLMAERDSKRYKSKWT